MNELTQSAIEKAKRGEALTEEEIDAICHALPEEVEQFKNAITPLWELISTALDNIIRWLTDVIPLMAYEVDKTLDACPNRRVIYLARHARKHRTRKKNIRRAFKITEKEAKK